MAELANCINCGVVFVKNIRNICRNCFEAEEKAFETVYQFLLPRKNRQATIIDIVDATGVEEKLIIKFMKEKRLRTSDFPMLAYGCDRCGKDRKSTRLNSSHVAISYAVFCLKKKKKQKNDTTLMNT